MFRALRKLNLISRAVPAVRKQSAIKLPLRARRPGRGVTLPCATIDIETNRRSIARMHVRAGRKFDGSSL